MRELVRSFRCLAFSAVAVGLAAGAHSAGGATPPPVALIVAGVLVALPIIALPERRLPAGSVVALLVALQTLLHVFFESATSQSDAMAHESPGAGMSASMVVAHAAATVLAAIVLWYGDCMITTFQKPVRRLVGRLFRGFTTVVSPIPVYLDIVADRQSCKPASQILSRIYRRGPPSGAVSPSPP